MPRIIIITEFVSPRLKYVCDILFNVILDTEFNITTQAASKPSDSLLINYSNKQVDRAINIIPSGLLNESSVQKQDEISEEFEGVETLFHSGKGDIPFDIFSACFFMLSRYEEYLPFEADIHDRLSCKQSIAYKIGFHDQPIVELWAKLLADRLNISFPGTKYNSILTIDIDDAWRYRNRGFLRSIGGLLKSILTLDFKTFVDRLKVILGGKDPFYTYDYLTAIAQKNRVPLHYFVLMGNKRKEDTAYRPNSRRFKNLIQKLNMSSVVGIHPSYASTTDSEMVNKETLNLQNIGGKEIKHSRQHYLLLKLPQTYQELIRLGIKNDYSLGWHDLPGFRAGISRSFPFYDLSTEETTELIIHPFVAMDRTLSDYSGLDPETAIKTLEELKEIVRKVGGQWSMIWHNDSVSDYGEWKGWRKVFETSVK